MPDKARVGVVGAGPAGLAMGRALREADIQFDIFEQNSGVGGIWNPDHHGSPMYHSAHFISSKSAPTSTFRGFPFPAGSATYPSHRDVRCYLETFAEKAGLLPHISLSCGVRHARLVADGWILELTDGRIERYSDLVCASGTLRDPIIPELPDSFAGHVRHSASYRSPDEVAGKSVLIVGAGNSGVDIACDVAKSAHRVMLSMRRGYWFVPKFIRGIPTDIFLRMPEGLPTWVHPPNAADLLELLVGHPTAYGFPEPDHAPFTSHSIMNSEVLHHVGHGRIIPRGSIVDATDCRITFSDGACDHIDEVIFATGYRASVPYLDDGILTYGVGTRPQLWLRLFHGKIPSLYGMGFIETNSGVFGLFDLGAELIAKYIRARGNGKANAAALRAVIDAGHEPDLTGGVTRISSPRHDGYVDSRAYQRTLSQTIAEYFDEGHGS